MIDLHDAIAVMDRYPGRWAVAGGWAIDLFLGRETRPHHDVDLGVLRTEQRLLRAFLVGSDARVAHDGVLRPWGLDEELGPALNEVHATWPTGVTLEFLLDEVDDAGSTGLYRRDTRVRRPLTTVFRTRDRTPYFSPEVVLLYKSKGTRAHDDADFAAGLPHLDSNVREWLADAIALADDSHRWLAALRGERDA